MTWKVIGFGVFIVKFADKKERGEADIREPNKP